MQYKGVMSAMELWCMNTSSNTVLTGNQPGCRWQHMDTETGETWRLFTSRMNTAQWTWTVASTSLLSGTHCWTQPELTQLTWPINPITFTPICISWLSPTLCSLIPLFTLHCVTSHHHYDPTAQPLVYKQQLSPVFYQFQLNVLTYCDPVLRILLVKFPVWLGKTTFWGP